MNEHLDRVAIGWFEKARNQKDSAKAHLNSRVRWSETVEAAQESIELSIKSMLSFLRIEFARSHAWNHESLIRIAEQINESGLLGKMRSQGLYWSPRLPRLLLINNLWAQFYLPAKYGFEQGALAPAQELFDQKEAELAVEHAEECCRAASEIRYLDEEKLASLRQF